MRIYFVAGLKVTTPIPGKGMSNVPEFPFFVKWDWKNHFVLNAYVLANSKTEAMTIVTRYFAKVEDPKRQIQITDCGDFATRGKKFPVRADRPKWWDYESWKPISGLWEAHYLNPVAYHLTPYTRIIGRLQFLAVQGIYLKAIQDDSETVSMESILNSGGGLFSEEIKVLESALTKRHGVHCGFNGPCIRCIAEKMYNLPNTQIWNPIIRDHAITVIYIGTVK
jgi:hypothetical protein